MMTRSIESVPLNLRRVLLAARATFDSLGLHRPAILAFKEGAGAVFIDVGELMTCDSGKDAVERIARAVVKQGVEQIAIISEAWTVMLPGVRTETEASPFFGHVSEHPNRVEILMVTWASADEELYVAANIVRDAEGKPTLGPWAIQELKQSKGRFCNFFRPEPEDQRYDCN